MPNSSCEQCCNFKPCDSHEPIPLFEIDVALTALKGRLPETYVNGRIIRVVGPGLVAYVTLDTYDDGSTDGLAAVPVGVSMITGDSMYTIKTTSDDDLWGDDITLGRLFSPAEAVQALAIWG